MSLVRRRMLWWPTWKGWLLLCAAVLLPPVCWALWGESYLASSARVSGAKILVVEGWIGRVALGGAAEEFKRGGYEQVIAAGCWSDDRAWSFAGVAQKELKKQGVPPEAIIEVALGDVARQRTFKTAQAVAAELEGDIGAINVFTLGAHARRSGAVYRKVFPEKTAVGRIGWWSRDAQEKNWWDSTARSKEFMTETVAYWVETLFGGGR